MDKSKYGSRNCFADKWTVWDLTQAEKSYIDELIHNG